MPLDKTSLSSAFKDLFTGNPAYPADVTEAGKKWAAAYHQYVSGATAGPTAPVAAVLTVAETALANALKAAFTTAKSAGPAGLAALTPLMDTAFVGFWMAPPVAFTTPPPPAPPTIAGVVSVAPPGVLTGLLSAAFAAGIAPGITPAQQANAIATVLDTWTKTVMIINTPITPPGPPAPPAPLA